MSREICITTFLGTGAGNYGSMLQAYALSEAIRQCGYEATFLGKFQVRSFELKHPMLLYARAYNKLNRKKNQAFFTPVKYEKTEARVRRLEAFREEHFRMRSFLSGAAWDKAVRDRMIFAAGSDILWNPARGYPSVPFLDFAYYAGLPRFSYGSSVGAQELPKQFYKAYRRYLGSMKEVGVREQSVADMLEGITGRKVTKVADPSLLLTRENWDRFAERAEISVPVSKDGYILCYFVMNDARYWEYVKKMQAATGKQIIVLPMHKMDEEQPYDIILDGTPYEFIRLIRDAEFICTDSFHACAVSLIYEKDFYLLPRTRKAEDAKYADFLGRYGLKDRTVTNEDRFETKGKTDYSFAAKQLEKDRAESREFLEKAIEECSK